MKWQRLSAAVRVVAGSLGTLMLFVASLSMISFFERSGAEQLERAIATLVICGITGVIFPLAAITGRSPAFFRAPAGFRSPLLDPVLASRGLRYVSWTRRGFDAVSGNSTRILRELTRGLAAGDVLLMHDREPVVLSVLPALLEQVSAQGLKAVSLASACADAPVE